MVTVREHYDEVLSPYYSRIFGDFETKVGEQQTLLERLGTRAVHRDGIAVDLGCGSGFQSIALARLGFRVLAIDFCSRLVEELNERASELLDGLPGFVFAAAGPVHVSGDLGLLAFNMGLPEQPPAVSGIDVALVRDGQIAVLHTLVTLRVEDR